MDAPRLSLRISFGVAVGIALTLTAMVLVEGWSNYSVSLFVLTPAFYGFFATVLYGHLYGTETEGLITRVMESAFLPALTAFILMLAFAFEGIICLVMAAPLIVLELIIGVAIGFVVLRLLPSRTHRACLVLVPFLYLALVGVERVYGRDDQYRPVSTAIEIAASPEGVWEHVVSFEELPAPTHWLFKTGIAYPLRARIVGSGDGAVRYCEFTTGPFVEPIEIWDAPHHLRFSVASSPAPMQELSPWGDIHPPHLNGFMESQQGEFRLTRLPNGHTRLEGTTWYRHGLGPTWYWTLWSDYVIHKIHTRVLLHIERLTVASETQKEVAS